MPIFRFLGKNSRFLGKNSRFLESFTKKNAFCDEKQGFFGNFSLYLATWMKIYVLGRKMWMDFFFGGNPDRGVQKLTWGLWEKVRKIAGRIRIFVHPQEEWRTVSTHCLSTGRLPLKVAISNLIRTERRGWTCGVNRQH